MSAWRGVWVVPACVVEWITRTSAGDVPPRRPGSPRAERTTRLDYSARYGVLLSQKIQFSIVEARSGAVITLEQSTLSHVQAAHQTPPPRPPSGAKTYVFKLNYFKTSIFEAGYKNS